MDGLIHIYCGDGKGKSTAAIGLTIRAVGSGMKVIFSQFMKNNNSSEIQILKGIDNVTIAHTKNSFGFPFQMTDEEKQSAKNEYRELFHYVTELARAKCMENSMNLVLLVMDELISAYNLDFVESDIVLNFLETKPKNLEVVMTGREPNEKLKELASYISYIQMEKHPFEQGIPSRRGIEW